MEAVVACVSVHSCVWQAWRHTTHTPTHAPRHSDIATLHWSLLFLPSSLSWRLLSTCPVTVCVDVRMYTHGVRVEERFFREPLSPLLIIILCSQLTSLRQSILVRRFAPFASGPIGYKNELTKTVTFCCMKHVNVRRTLTRKQSVPTFSQNYTVREYGWHGPRKRSSIDSQCKI